MMWTRDPETGLFTIGNMMALELGTLSAAVCAGFSIIPQGSQIDTLGAEAARRNLINYTGDLGQAQTNHLLGIVIAADTYRITGHYR